MKKISFLAIIALMIAANSVISQHKEYASIAQKMVNNSLMVQPGESVIISGTPAELDLLQELYVEVSKAGGKPTIELGIPDANKRALMETPVDYLKIPDVYQMMKLKSVDCFIQVGSVQNPDLFKDVPEEKVAEVRKANQWFANVYQTSDFRSVSLGQVGGIPTEAYAKTVGADHSTMLDMFWNAVDVDYEAMLEKGTKIGDLMKPGSKVEITSPEGTNLSFTIGDTAPRTNCGKTSESMGKSGPANAWLPAGEVYTIVDDNSANGTLVVPHKRWMGTTIRNLKFTFVDGKITSMEAAEGGEGLKQAIDLGTGMKDVLSLIDIGINANSHPLEGSDYLSYEMAGIVTLGIGANSWAGGSIESDFGTDFNLANTMIKIDGNTIIEDGQLK